MLLTYPLFSHLAVITGYPVWAAVYLLLTIGLFLVRCLQHRNYKTTFVLSALLIFGAALVVQENFVFLMYLPPVVISLGLLLLFGRSLQQGNVPLVTRYAQYIDGELNNELLRYTRRVTQIWVVFFLVMLVESIGLALFAPITIWSLFTNVLNYVAIGILVLAEFIYRHRAYPNLPKRNFLQFLQRIISVRPGQLRAENRKAGGGQYTLFHNLPTDTPIAFRDGKYISREQFRSHVCSIANTLPDHQYAINLCEDRYMFMVTFVACLLKKQTSLLPPNRAKNEVNCLDKTYLDSYHIIDKPSGNDPSRNYLAQLENIDVSDWPEIGIDNELVAAILFTSGSTGSPKPNPKIWKDLVSSALKVRRQLQLGENGLETIVATVPPQHMFGFEMSIIHPLINGAVVHCDKPFFPHDVCKALGEIEAPRVLVTTPLHLRACYESNLDWPTINSLISATAPLPEQVAKAAEEKLDVEVQEVYGCSEVGAIATRRSTKELSWNLLDGYKLINKLNHFWLKVPDIDTEIELPDRIKVENEIQFTLIGRHSDLVKIGGMRGSLADLTIKLKGLNGVKDGIFFIPETTEDSQMRLAALVVAPDINEKDILDQLADCIDQVFLPRPLLKVDRLPYNETGKLPKQAILSILKSTRKARLLLETA